MSVSGSRGAAPGVHRIDVAEATGGLAANNPLHRWLLREPGVVYRAATGRAEVALSFDDGPSRWTAEIAAIFAEHGCLATFFLSGPAIARRKSDVASLADAGHELGNHLWTHADPTTQSRAELRTEIRRASEAVRTVTGRRPRLVRPPYCKAPENVAAAARRCGVRWVVQRSVGSADWSARSADEISAPLLATVEAGDIVGLHDGLSPDERDSDSREVTVAAVKQLVPGLLDRGLQPVTVSRLLR